VSVTKPQTFNADLEHLPAVLAPLTKEPRWVVWPWELRTTESGKEKWTKPPRQARDPSRNARSNDPTTWGTYEEAITAVRAGDADGIGYMLLDSNVGAIDLDHCVDREAGAKLDPWAQDLHEEASDAYQEVTVSGGGLRIIGIVNGPETHRKFTFDRTLQRSMPWQPAPSSGAIACSRFPATSYWRRSARGSGSHARPAS
jgi:primase-polymerase (primpol)-like protein